LASPALAQWPTTCVDLNDIVEAHLGNHGNVGIYQRTFGRQAEQSCQNDHRDDVRGVLAWAFEIATVSAIGSPLPFDELVARSQAAVRYIRTVGTACGSAFVVTADGYVVTNSHVLSGVDQVVVATSDGQEEFASIVANSPERDLALLKLPSRGPHPFLAFGRSDDLEVGDVLTILGYPLCLETFTHSRAPSRIANRAGCRRMRQQILATVGDRRSMSRAESSAWRRSGPVLASRLGRTTRIC